MNKWLGLLRVQQWYKNVVVFLALFFTKNLFNVPLLIETVLGFAALCLTSSAYYVINDVHDAKKDRLHPEKKNRSIASGEVSVKAALALSAILLVSATAFSYAINPLFAFFPMVLYLVNIAYTLYFRDIPIVDVHVISVNFLLKAVAGAVLIKVPPSVWLIASVYFIALFLAAAKRLGDLAFLGDDAAKFKSVYGVYTKELLEKMILIIVSVLLFTYIMYTFKAHEKPYLMLTIPFATFMVFRFLYLVSVNHESIRRVEYVFRDRQILMCLIFWIISSYIILGFVL